MKPIDFLFIIILFFMSSCSNNKQTEELQSTLQNNEKFDTKVNIQIQFIKKFGELEKKDFNYHFFEITDLTKDSDGNIYIIDMGNYRIQKFDSTGNFVLSFGRKGRGPGEFLAPMSIDLDDQGNIWVADQIGTIQKFSMNGEFLLSFRIPVRITFYVHFLENGLFAYRTRHMDAKASGFGKLTPLVKIFDADNNNIVEFGKPQKYNNDIDTFKGNHYVSAVDKENNFYLSFCTQNRIEKYSPDGKMLLQFDRHLNYNVLPPIVDGKNGMTIQRPTYVSAGIQIDKKNRIWVLTYTRQPRLSITGSGENKEYMKKLLTEENIQKFEIFDTYGNLVKEIPVKHNVKHFKIFDDYIYFINNDNFTILEYKIVEKE